MLKNLLLFIGLLISIIISFNNLSAETISLIPLKKPVLSNDEFNKKISKNIIKPIRKPKKDKIVSIEKKKDNVQNSNNNLANIKNISH